MSKSVGLKNVTPSSTHKHTQRERERERERERVSERVSERERETHQKTFVDTTNVSSYKKQNISIPKHTEKTNVVIKGLSSFGRKK